MFVSALAFTGCSKAPDVAILGTWALDGEATAETLNQGDQMAANLMLAASATHTYTFEEGGAVTVEYSYGDDTWTRTGEWTVGNADGNKQYYRIEPSAAADWSGYSIYMRDGELRGPLGTNSEEVGVFSN
jgi:hypothetical protein